MIYDKFGFKGGQAGPTDVSRKTGPPLYLFFLRVPKMMSFLLNHATARGFPLQKNDYQG